MNRREFLLFFSAVTGTVALKESFGTRPSISGSTAQTAILPGKPPLPSVLGPMPLTTSGVVIAQQPATFQQFNVADDLVLPKDYEYKVLAAWGDRVGNSRFGYNNDYLSLVETSPNEGYLSVNFEYVSALPWIQSYEAVLGKSLPFQPVQVAVKAAGKKGIDAFTLTDSDVLKQQIAQISKEALIDQGLGIISVRKNPQGVWERTYSKADRRITGISGLDDQNYLRTSGPAQAVFKKLQGQGYNDKLGDRIIGSMANCAAPHLGGRS
jgi:uncharacterized protein